MKQSKYIALIHKELNASISASEQEELAHWLNESPDNSALKEEIIAVWDMSNQYQKNYTPDVEKGLATLKQRIKADSAKDAKVVSMPPKKDNRWLAIAASVAILIVAGLLWNQFQTGSNNLQSLVSVENQVKEVTLPDGSKVWINQETELKYPQAFDGNNRIVYLNGEAFFDIQRNTSKPFIIKTKDTEVTVLGTSFNVSAYDNTQTTSINVKTGKVQLKVNATSDKLILVANEKAVFDNKANTLVKSKDKDLNAIAWQSGQLIFRKTRLVDAISDIENYYRVKISLTNTDLLECEYTSLFNNKELDSVLKSLSEAFSMSMQQENSTSYRLIGGSCD